MNEYHIWLDDERECTNGGFMHFRSVNDLKRYISGRTGVFYLDLDHDLGEYAKDGGDAIELIKWMLEEGFHENPEYRFFFHLHTQNVVGRMNMEALIDRYFRR